MIYHINTNGDIIGTSRENINNQRQVFGPDVIDVIDEKIYSPAEYRYENGEFVQKPDSYFDLPKSTLYVDETINIGIGAGSVVEVSGPSFYHYGPVDGTNIEFSSERVGLYKFALLTYPAKEVFFEIEVIA